MVAPLIANGSTIRVTKVDNCGRPRCGDSAFVSECWAKVSMEAEIDDGEDVEFKAANGTLCGVKPACPTLKYYEITLELWQGSPELMSILTGMDPDDILRDAKGNPNGFDTCSLACREGFALEIWAEVLDAGDVCEEDYEEGKGAWMYILIPWVTQGILGDMEIGEEAVSFELTAKTRAVAEKGGWQEGPWDVMSQPDGSDGPMLTPMKKNCHRRFMIVDVEPPKPSDTFIETFPCKEESESEESESEDSSTGESSGGRESSVGESGEESDVVDKLFGDPALMARLKKELARA